MIVLTLLVAIAASVEMAMMLQTQRNVLVSVNIVCLDCC